MLQQTTTARDSLPQAREDYTLDFDSTCGAPSRCRIRVYQPLTGPTVIVATESPDNPGGSVTNTAERVHYLAWERAGMPVPVLFIEHYPGHPRREGTPRTTFTEEFDQVVFPLDGAGRPEFSQRMLYAGRWEMQFDEADWRPFGREALLSLLVGQGAVTRGAP